MDRLTAKEVAKIIQEQFCQTLSKYDYKKYPPQEYEEFKSVFSSRCSENFALADALRWKYGNWRKRNYPKSHKNLEREAVAAWPRFVDCDASGNPEQTFLWWQKEFGRPTTFITSAFYNAFGPQC